MATIVSAFSLQRWPLADGLALAVDGKQHVVRCQERLVHRATLHVSACGFQSEEALAAVELCLTPRSTSFLYGLDGGFVCCVFARRKGLDCHADFWVRAMVIMPETG